MTDIWLHVQFVANTLLLHFLPQNITLQGYLHRRQRGGLTQCPHQAVPEDVGGPDDELLPAATCVDPVAERDSGVVGGRGLTGRRAAAEFHPWRTGRGRAG